MFYGIRGSTCIVTTLKQSCRKVMILHLSVILFTGGISVHGLFPRGISVHGEDLSGRPPCGKEWLAVSPAMHVPCHAHPSHHTHMSPTMHTPCHACPLPCTLPAMHAPTMLTPHHVCLPPCMPPCHTCPLCHTCPHHACTHYLPTTSFVGDNNILLPNVNSSTKARFNADAWCEYTLMSLYTTQTLVF